MTGTPSISAELQGRTVTRCLFPGDRAGQVYRSGVHLGGREGLGEYTDALKPPHSTLLLLGVLFERLGKQDSEEMLTCRALLYLLRRDFPPCSSLQYAWAPLPVLDLGRGAGGHYPLPPGHRSAETGSGRSRPGGEPGVGAV